MCDSYDENRRDAMATQKTFSWQDFFSRLRTWRRCFAATDADQFVLHTTEHRIITTILIK